MQALKSNILHLIPPPNLELVPISEQAWECEACHDMGFIKFDVPIGDPRFGKPFPCDNPDCPTMQRNRAERQARLLSRARIHDEFTGMTLQSWLDGLPSSASNDNLPIWTAARLLVENGSVCVEDIYRALGWKWDGREDMARNSLVFHGPVGTGKTALACAIANETIFRGRDAIYTRCTDLIAEIQDRYNPDSDLKESPTDIINTFKMASLLVIDEFAVERRSDDRIEKLNTIIDYRNGNYLPTIVTGNFENPDQFERMWGRPTTDRLCKMAHWLYFSGPKLRNTYNYTGIFKPQAQS